MEQRVQFQFEGRYYVLGEVSEQIENLWFVCHGHGHLAQFFIKKFDCLDDGKTLIVAPEGLSRYYLKGFTGRVGATWMTKEDRQTDIKNYLIYLETVFNQIRSKLKREVKVTLLGFSQGAATISRFATQTDVEFHRLVLWAGIFPPDLPPLQSAEKLKDKKVYWVYGTKDPYLSAGIIKEQKFIAEQIKVAPEVLSFEGEHELYEKVLMKISSIV